VHQVRCLAADFVSHALTVLGSHPCRSARDSCKRFFYCFSRILFDSTSIQVSLALGQCTSALLCPPLIPLKLSVLIHSQVPLSSVGGQVSLLPIFLFALVSRCVGQEHVHSGLDFTLSFRFRSSCSVFAPHSGVSSCSKAGPVSSWIFRAKSVVPARCCFHQCIKSSTPDLIFSLLPLSQFSSVVVLQFTCRCRPESAPSQFFDLCLFCVWIVAGTRYGLTLELPDRKAQCFLASIVLKQLFPEHARKVFGEMPVRI
jgi:hypothetical protein